MQFQIKSLIQQLDPQGFIDFTPLGYPWKTQWPLTNNYPAKVNKHLIFQDCLTFNNNVCLELEWYKRNCKDLEKYIFYSPHYGLHEAYPDLNIVYFNWILYYNSYCFNKAKELFLHHFVDKQMPEKPLCLMRNQRPHRDVFYNFLKDQNINLSYQSIGIEPDYPGLAMKDYWNSNIPNVRNFLSMTKNYQYASKALVVETMYSEPYPFVTEKTLQPFIAKLPIVPLCQKHYVENLLYLGFDCDYLDKEFDAMPDNIRYKQAMQSNIDVSHDTLAHNQHLALTVWKVLLQKLQHQLSRIIE